MPPSSTLLQLGHRALHSQWGAFRIVHSGHRLHPGQAHRSMRGDRSLLSNAYLTFSLHLGLRPWRAIPQAHQAHSNPLGLLLCPESNTRATQSFSHSPGDAPIHIFNNSFETIHIPYDSLTWCHSKFFSTFGVVQQSPQSNLELFNWDIICVL